MSNQIPPLSVAVESWGISQTGRTRTENQDAYLDLPDRLLWMVADGVRGTDHGAVASQCLARSLLHVPPPASLDDHVAATRQWLQGANHLLRRQMSVARATAASTVVVLLVHARRCACLWAGDSRCYLLRNGVLYQCTRDHTLRQERIDQEELTAAEARRMVRGNIITNAVGIRDQLHLAEVRFPVYPGDRFLLCSDGLSNILAPEALAQFLKADTVHAAAGEILTAITDMMQPDNITFVAVFLSPST